MTGRLFMNIRFIALGAIFATMAVVFIGGVAQAEPAFTCNYSGQNGTNRQPTEEGTYTGTLTYKDGNCVMQKPTGSASPKLPNGSCASDTAKPHSDGCYEYVEEVTNQKPTFIDGSQVPMETWETMCGQTRHAGTAVDREMTYNSNNHRCEGGAGCYGDSTSVYNDYLTRGGACVMIDDPNNGVTLENSISDEDKKKIDKVNECVNAGATFNGQTHECDWTPETCQAKNGGQGVWIRESNECKAYSDFTNREDCEGPPVDGEFKLIDDKDNDNPADDHYECVKPGTDGSEEEEDPATPPSGQNPTVDGQCGQARTNLISCGSDTGAAAFNGVLRIIVIVLSIGVGVAAVGGIAWASLRYAGASDNEGQVSEAKDLIKNIIIGLLLYVFLVAITNWLVPGGVF